MNFLIDQGLAFYWGTSEWSAQMIEEAKGIAKEAGPLMAPPIFEQVSYSMLMRERVEMEHRRYRQPDSRTVLAFAGMAMGPPTFEPVMVPDSIAFMFVFAAGSTLSLGSRLSPPCKVACSQASTPQTHRPGAQSGAVRAAATCRRSQSRSRRSSRRSRRS
jgi:hypothetical protein